MNPPATSRLGDSAEECGNPGVKYTRSCEDISTRGNMRSNQEINSTAQVPLIIAPEPTPRCLNERILTDPTAKRKLILWPRDSSWKRQDPRPRNPVSPSSPSAKPVPLPNLPALPTHPAATSSTLSSHSTCHAKRFYHPLIYPLILFPPPFPSLPALHPLPIHPTTTTPLPTLLNKPHIKPKETESTPDTLTHTSTEDTESRISCKL